MYARLAGLAAIELGSQLAGGRVAYNGQCGLDSFLGHDRRRAPRLGTWLDVAGPSVEPDPSLRRCLANIESRSDLRVTLVAGLVRLHNTQSKLDGVRFRHAPPDQKRIHNSSPRISRGEHWG
jgi:hypothetical protein